MWSTTTPRQIGLPPEFFFVAPTHHHPDAAASGISFDQHSLNAGLLSEDGRGGMQLWQQTGYQLGLNSPASYVRKPVIIGADQHADLLLSGGGAATCQDCGNQAKKDCTHRRCRSCCKSRGFDCATHVKSTWVSAVRRRERQLMGSNAAAAASSQSQSTSSAKKPRLASQTTSHTSTSNNDTSSSHQDAGSMPAQVNAPAVFKCVRVTSVEDGEDEYAYQAVVRIGGRVFKGFLYDQGVDAGAKDQGIFPNISDLHLGGVGQTHDLYSGGGGLIGGSNYGNTMN